MLLRLPPLVLLRLPLRLYRIPNSLVCNKFVHTDKLTKNNTGLVSMNCLNAMVNLITPKASGMQYWVGAKRTLVKGRLSKRKDARQLSIKDELVLVLMKIRLGLTNAFLACLFNISVGTCSSIVNTYIKFLGKELQPLVFWPAKEEIIKMIPNSLKVKYPTLRCTLDCSETFIQRPRDLYLQASTWSDYKHPVKHHCKIYGIYCSQWTHFICIVQDFGQGYSAGVRNFRFN